MGLQSQFTLKLYSHLKSLSPKKEIRTNWVSISTGSIFYSLIQCISVRNPSTSNVVCRFVFAKHHSPVTRAAFHPEDERRKRQSPGPSPLTHRHPLPEVVREIKQRRKWNNWREMRDLCQPACFSHSCGKMSVQPVLHFKLNGPLNLRHVSPKTRIKKFLFLLLVSGFWVERLGKKTSRSNPSSYNSQQGLLPLLSVADSHTHSSGSATSLTSFPVDIIPWFSHHFVLPAVSFPVSVSFPSQWHLTVRCAISYRFSYSFLSVPARGVQNSLLIRFPETFQLTLQGVFLNICCIQSCFSNSIPVQATTLKSFNLFLELKKHRSIILLHSFQRPVFQVPSNLQPQSFLCGYSVSPILFYNRFKTSPNQPDS